MLLELIAPAMAVSNTIICTTASSQHRIFHSAVNKNRFSRYTVNQSIRLNHFLLISHRFLIPRPGFQPAGIHKHGDILMQMAARLLTHSHAHQYAPPPVRPVAPRSSFLRLRLSRSIGERWRRLLTQREPSPERIQVPGDLDRILARRRQEVAVQGSQPAPPHRPCLIEEPAFTAIASGGENQSDKSQLLSHEKHKVYRESSVHVRPGGTSSLQSSCHPPFIPSIGIHH
ncbi:hypothetical protein EDB81DRAFT_784541 [Dactylonectria macrodidyma]|uniref:Uncharacterized protein n=1 Tax=Dactylonectria macrodidyma TaxID=307937 RepID=A0A9P9FH06_9HYPO|nr:hypothetical protein EDB81DRAFT_784541 [Dactylonectria macrodidyma]